MDLEARERKRNRKMKRILPLRRIPAAVCFLFVLVFMVSCREQENRDRKIQIVMEDYPADSENAAQIPSFVSKDEQVSRNLRELEKQTRALKKIVDREQKKDSFLEMVSYPLDLEAYPQVTVVWKTKEDDSFLYNLVSLGADEAAGQPITCKEALERTGMTGVDLSLQVGKLSKEAGLRGDLTATEMQGFRINEKGEVVEIYMKLTTEVRDGEDTREEEHFFSYVTGEEKLEKLSERGFDVP